MIKISLAAARTNAGYTQKQVAEALGIAVSTVRNWETGITTPNVAQAYALCELYGGLDLSQYGGGTKMKPQNKPSGIDLLATLINLLAEQEGVEIKYILTNK